MNSVSVDQHYLAGATVTCLTLPWLIKLEYSNIDSKGVL